MTDPYSMDALEDLKLPALRSLCVQARNEGRLAAKTKCVGSRAKLLTILSQASRDSTPSKVITSTRNRDTTPTISQPSSPISLSQPATTNITIDLPFDLINILCCYVDMHQLYSILAANPQNADLVRGLYHPNSYFWAQRVGAQTGHSCLVDRENGSSLVQITAETGGWSFKDQHDAIVPRAGYAVVSTHTLVNSRKYRSKAIHDRTNASVMTNLRVKALYSTSRDRDIYTETEEPRNVRLIALWEDGSVRELVKTVNPPGRTGDAVFHTASGKMMRTVVEDHANWNVLGRREESLGNDVRLDYDLPPMKTMVVSGNNRIGARGVIWFLDYEGNMWLLDSVTELYGLSRVVVPPDVGSIRYIQSSPITSDDDDSPDKVRDVIATSEEGIEYIVMAQKIPAYGSQRTTGMSRATPKGGGVWTVYATIVVPCFIPIPEEAKTLAHSVPRDGLDMSPITDVQDEYEYLPFRAPYLAYSVLALEVSDVYGSGAHSTLPDGMKLHTRSGRHLAWDPKTITYYSIMAPARILPAPDAVEGKGEKAPWYLVNDAVPIKHWDMNQDTRYLSSNVSGIGAETTYDVRRVYSIYFPILPLWSMWSRMVINHTRNEPESMPTLSETIHTKLPRGEDSNTEVYTARLSGGRVVCGDLGTPSIYTLVRTTRYPRLPPPGHTVPDMDVALYHSADITQDVGVYGVAV